MQRRVGALAAAGITVALGLASRRPGLSPFVHAYVGDALYAVMVTLLLRAAFPRRPVAFPALALCFAIEASQAVHPPWLDALRATRLGALVLGRGFLWSDLVCYTVGVGAVAGVEAAWGRWGRPR
jgi:hypothetical protein